MQKDLLIAEVLRHKEQLLALSHKIHACPEPGFQEYRAVEWQLEILRHHGFRVESPFCGLETAYKAVFPGRGDGPRVALLAEYDALPGVGHGCGHNIIAASAIGAAIALSKAVGSVPGQVVVLGTPAEESGGGKILLADKGAFGQIDFAMMMHPATRNQIGRGALAAVTVKVEYRGKAAHSATPDKGINALAALIALFNAVDAMRPAWRPQQGTKANGIITAGGTAPNVVPDYAAGLLCVRSKTRSYLLQVIADIEKAAVAAGRGVGAKTSTCRGPVYAERYPSRLMGEAFKSNLAPLGEPMSYPDPDEAVGSSDIGNVSLLVPTIHEYLAIAPESVTAHSAEFAAAAVSPRGDEVVIKAAQGLALTAWDLFTDSDLRENVQREFRDQLRQADQ